MANSIVNKLKKAYGKTMAFKDLPMGAKMAMIWYMAINGGAWETPDNVGDIKFNWAAKKGITKETELKYQRFLQRNMAWFDKRYGNKRFGLAMVPREEYEKSLLANFKKNPEMTHLHTKEAFLEEFKGVGVNHKTAAWPVIFSTFPEELIQDGWHRQHCYLSKKFPVIPCLYYLR